MSQEPDCNTEQNAVSSDLILAIKELAFQSEEKEKRAAELIIANKKLLFENGEKEDRASELIIANKKLRFENEEKEKRAAELIIANKELAFQSEEKEKRAAELIIANKKLLFENGEKEKRANELIVANKKLLFENEEKEKRANELVIANEKLRFENEEKEKRAAELVVANKELAFQNKEKLKRAVELIVANKKLIVANNELIAFTYISGHDLQEPLRKIQTFISVILDKEDQNLSTKGKFNFQRIQVSAARMQQLLSDLLEFSRTNSAERKFKKTSLQTILEEVKEELADTISKQQVIIEMNQTNDVNIIAFQFRQLFYHLLDNAIKFARPNEQAHIIIESTRGKGLVFPQQRLIPEKEYCHITIQDNGIGFEPEYNHRIFGVFQKLHNTEEYIGTGIGLAIVKKIVDNHNGIITATSKLGEGAKFDIYIPY